MSITVCIATIPTRQKLLRRAIWSVINQTLPPYAVIIECDHDRTGAVDTKNRALYKVKTPWVAWLDDDDYFLPEHLEKLMAAQEESKADVVYAWPIMDGAADPTPHRFGVPFDADGLRAGSYVHTTALFRSRMAQRAGGFCYPAKAAEDGVKRDDHGLWLSMLSQGAKFHHLPERTWVWNVNGQNTSGNPDRW
jgi:glycosyltransferase involved in cell wall biosynthesis